MDFGDLSDNPFAAQLAVAPQSKRPAVLSAVKLLLLVAVGLSLTLVVGSQSKKWLIHQLTHDLGSLTGDEKQVRLGQIADLGPIGIRPLVQTLADEDTEVARTSYDLLRQAQNKWTVLEQSEMERCHQTMVDELAAVAVQIPDDRTGWGTLLLQQTLMATVDRKDEQSQKLFREATHAMELLSLSDRSGPSILSDEPLDPNAPKRLTVQSRPLPVSTGVSASEWTDWPPPKTRPAVSNPTQASDVTIMSGGRTGVVETQTDVPVETDPSVYRSSAVRLQPVDPKDPVILRDVNSRHETAHQTVQQSAEATDQEIRSVTHLVDSPMETFDDASVIHWLGSPHTSLREKARLELTSRGYDRGQLDIATQIASGDSTTRIELIEAIARSGSIDPRPWLFMMLDDESRNVKLRVISVLATMDDPAIKRRLRNRLSDERDPTVAARIRRVLDLR